MGVPFTYGAEQFGLLEVTISLLIIFNSKEMLKSNLFVPSSMYPLEADPVLWCSAFE